MVRRVKYPRTSHLPWSPGATSDDKILQDLSRLSPSMTDDQILDAIAALADTQAGAGIPFRILRDEDGALRAETRLPRRLSASWGTVPMGLGALAAAGVSMARRERGCLAVLRTGRLLGRLLDHPVRFDRYLRRFPEPGPVGAFDLLLPEPPETAHARLAIETQEMDRLARETGLRPGRILIHRVTTPWIQAHLPGLRVAIGIVPADGTGLGLLSPPSLCFSIP